MTERAAIADALEKVIENQQGKRTDLDPTLAKDLKKASAEDRAKLTSAPRGQSRKGAKVAKAAGFTSRQQRDRVKNVIANGTPALVEKMDVGEINPTTADKIAKHPVAEQTKVLAEKTKAKTKRRTDKTRQKAAVTERKKEQVALRNATPQEARDAYITWLKKQPKKIRIKEVRYIFDASEVAFRDLGTPIGVLKYEGDRS